MQMHTVAIFLAIVVQLRAQVQVDTGGVAERFDDGTLEVWAPEDWSTDGNEDWSTNIDGAAGRLLAAGKLDMAQLKHPVPANFLYIADNRKSIPGKKGTDVVKKGAEMWKALPDAKKKVYVDRFLKAKEQRTAYLAKVKDTQEFKDYMATKAAARTKSLKRKMSRAKKTVSKDAKLKRPATAYISFVTESKLAGRVGIKKASEMWNNMPANKKQTYVDTAQQAKKEYDAYIASSKGASALKVYKSAIEQAIAPMKATTDGAKLAAKTKQQKEKAKARKAKLTASNKAAREKLKKKKASVMARYKLLLKKTAAAKAAANAAGKAGAKAATRPSVKKLSEEYEDIISIRAAALIALFTVSGFTLAALRFHRSSEHGGKRPLLAA